jgi:phosphatidylglycerol:prolipoprotein diacylglycerol transferase
MEAKGEKTMYPTIFGFIDSYVLMILIGVLLCFLILNLYFKKIKEEKKLILDIELVGIIAIVFGFVFANLFQNIYEFIASPSTYTYTLGLTFYGGLIGGVIGFILFYFILIRKKYGPKMDKILVVAPSCITIAHGFGRIGCFLDGCCYGIETTSFLGIKFPGMVNKVYPTQLFEAIFLILFSLILTLIIFKTKFKYTMPLYMLGYGIFRFLIEFIRGDERGKFIGSLSPSQFWCIVIVILSVGVYFLMKYYIFKGKTYEKE